MAHVNEAGLENTWQQRAPTQAKTHVPNMGHSIPARQMKWLRKHYLYTMITQQLFIMLS